MKIHLIAIGGAVMHNLALALHTAGNQVTGSDDEIKNPARDRLAAKKLLPDTLGWDTTRLNTEIDLVILGMHAHADNPELAEAQRIGLKILSFPEFIYQHSQYKKRVVVAGSHGKTTTTAMVMHILQRCNVDFDYLVGAQLTGFETMVRLSDAPIMVIEGDEYLSSALLPVPKFHLYAPHISVITGVAWDHINVFPTWENYVEQFQIYIKKITTGGSHIYFQGDETLASLYVPDNINAIPYHTPDFEIVDSQFFIIEKEKKYPLQIFGIHNLQNLRAAWHVCRELGLPDEEILQAAADFQGAAQRLEKAIETDDCTVFLDFAHAPSKVRATAAAVRAMYPDRHFVALLELHTFSSLTRDFLPEFAHSLSPANDAAVFYSPHTLVHKRLPYFEPNVVRDAFAQPNLNIFTEKTDLEHFIKKINLTNSVILVMSSGNFDQVNPINLLKIRL